MGCREPLEDQDIVRCHACLKTEGLGGRQER